MELLTLGIILFFLIIGCGVIYFFIQLFVKLTFIVYLIRVLPIILGVVVIYLIVVGIMNVRKQKKTKYWEDKKSKINNLTLEEFLQLTAEILKEQEYKLIEIKQHLWWVLMSVTKDNKNYLCVAPNISDDMDFDRFAEGLNHLKQKINNNYTRCYLISQDKQNTVYNKLLIKCCKALHMPIHNETWILKQIDTKILSKQKNKKPKETTPKTVYKKDKYEKCFPNVMIDENDVSVDDSDEFIDDMMFMDLMDED